MPNNKESLIKTKPQIINNSLSLKSRNLTSLSEITSWFSDNELAEIKELDLTGNKISSLEGIDLYVNLQRLNLTNNSFTEINKEDIDRINDIYLDENNYGFSLTLFRNEISSNMWESQIEVDEILSTYTGKIVIDGNYNPKYVTDYDMVRLEIDTDNLSIDEYHPKSKYHPKNIKDNKKTESSDNTFFWTFIHLFAPLIIAGILSLFEKDFTTGLIFGFAASIVLPFIAITNSTRKVKTGRSLETDNGLKFDEYEKKITYGIVLGKVHYYILLLHIIIAIVWYYVKNHT